MEEPRVFGVFLMVDTPLFGVFLFTDTHGASQVASPPVVAQAEKETEILLDRQGRNGDTAAMKNELTLAQLVALLGGTLSR